MDNQKDELVKRLKEANNILVTVSSNPSVDQLSALIGLTLLLNKMKKHATAVFSGQVPSTIEFLKPSDTIETNTDSLRDFIISLDKSKADKLRYKVEDNIVKIFITPYKTSINENDLDFSQGDFNVDVVLCLGVDKQQDLDQAITSHGRILHDATVAVVSVQQSAELGSLNWSNPQASSLSEMAADLAQALDKKELDGQIATSLLTGIVAETERFSNDKTSPNAMQLASVLMSAGANQQLVASELQSGGDSLLGSSAGSSDQVSVDDNGTLEIGHTPDSEDAEPPLPAAEPPQPPAESHDDDSRDFLLGDTPPELGHAKAEGDSAYNPGGEEDTPASRLILQPPSMGGTLTANSKPEGLDPAIDPLTMMNSDASPLLTHGKPADDAPASDANVPLPDVQDQDVDAPIVADIPEPPAMPAEPAPPEASAPEPAPVAVPEPPIAPPTMPEPPAETPQPAPEPTPAPAPEPPAASVADGVPGFEPLPSEPQTPPAAAPVPDDNAPMSTQPVSDQSLTDLEASVDSPHVAADTVPIHDDNVDAARDAVMDAINSGPATGPLTPNESVGADGYLNVQDLPDTTESTTAPDMPMSNGMPPVSPEPTPLQDAAPVAGSPADTPLNMPLPPTGGVTIPPADPNPPTSGSADTSTAPPVPPPLPFDDLTKFTGPAK